MSSRNGTEIMTIGALKYNPLSIQEHPLILHLKFAEAHSLRDIFRRFAIRADTLRLQLI